MRFRFVRALALVCFGALLSGGGAYAAGQITGAQVRNGSLTGRDVKDHSLTAKDFRGSLRGPAGLRGPQGPAGPAGPAGAAASAVSGITRVVSATRTIDAGEISKQFAKCPSGTRPISGGYVTTGPGRVTYSEDLSGGWYVGVDNSAESVASTVRVVAFCAS